MGEVYSYEIDDIKSDLRHLEEKIDDMSLESLIEKFYKKREEREERELALVKQIRALEAELFKIKKKNKKDKSNV